MPRIGSQSKSFTNKAGEKFEFSSIINVNSDGIFSVSFPCECRQCVQKCCERTAYHTEKHPSNTYIYGEELSKCHSLVAAGIEMFMAVEMKEEIIIRYKHNCSFSAWEDRFGEYHPNGYFDNGRKDDDGSGWVEGGGVHACQHTDQFMFGLGAALFVKKTYTRGDVVNAIYESVRWHFQGMEISLGEYGEKLAGFNHVKVEKSGSKEIVYTELAAEFFFNSMIGIAKMAIIFDGFFNDDLKIKQAIENKSFPLIGMENPE